MNVRAALVAGGLATRMKSVTGLPKAMLPIAGRPLLFHHLDALAAAGIDDVTICAGRRAEDLESSIAYRDDLRVRLVEEEALLGSGGCIGAACAGGDGDLLVVFGDVLSNVDLTPLVAAHRSRSAGATMVVHATDHPWDSDVVETDPGGWIVAIHRKPHPPGDLRFDLAVAGMFVLSAPVVRGIGTEAPSDLVHDVLPRALDAGVRLFAYETREYLRDIGTPDRYAAACADWEGR